MDDEIFTRMMPLAAPDLNEPVLIYALEGWIDAGMGTATAIATLLSTVHTEPLATFDTDYFIDQRARRPMVRIVDGVTIELTWTEISLRWGRDHDGADILFLVGPEPDFHWSDFVDAVTDAALSYNVRLALGLGAFPAPPRTPVPCASLAPLPNRVPTCSQASARSRVNSKCPPASTRPSSWDLRMLTSK